MPLLIGLQYSLLALFTAPTGLKHGYHGLATIGAQTGVEVQLLSTAEVHRGGTRAYDAL